MLAQAPVILLVFTAKMICSLIVGLLRWEKSTVSQYLYRERVLPSKENIYLLFSSPFFFFKKKKKAQFLHSVVFGLTIMTHLYVNSLPKVTPLQHGSVLFQLNHPR